METIKSINSLEQKIVNLLTNSGAQSLNQLSVKLMEFEPKEVSRLLKKIVAEGKVETNIDKEGVHPFEATFEIKK